MSRDVTLFIDDMIEACQRIDQYSAGLNRESLNVGTMVTDAIVRNLEILGEAAKSVPADVRTREPDIPWRRIAGLRDVLSHTYFSIDLQHAHPRLLHADRRCRISMVASPEL